MQEIISNNQDKLVLNLFYNRFYDLYDEIISDGFFNKSPKERFYLIREIFAIYNELLAYKPIKYYLKYMKLGGRPPLEGILAEDLTNFIRNLLAHFPIFDKWDDVYINKNLATWNKKGAIHKFLNKAICIKIDKKGILKYRMWEKDKEKMTYVTVFFPEKYDENNIFLKDIISEKHGVKLCVAIMRQVLDYQVKDVKEPNIVIMSQVYFPAKTTDENS